MENYNDNKEELLTELFEILGNQLPDEEPSPSKASTSKNNFQSVQIIEGAQTLNEQEKEVLKKAAIERESGLTALRKNEIPTGLQKLNLAKQIISENSISQEGILIASTYQHAAEAFLHLKNKDFEGAIDATRQAMETHKDLFNSFGHLIEQRRIHLARNIAKVLTVSGQPEKSFVLTIDLIQYTIQAKTKWRLDFCQLENPNSITQNQKYFVLNQLMSELGDILSKRLVTKELAISNLSKLTTLHHSSNEDDFSLISDWAKAYLAYINRNQKDFLKNGIQFFKKYTNQLPKAHSYLLMCLQELIE